MSKKTTLEEAKNILLEISQGKISIIEYSGIGNRGIFECAVCGNIWSARAFDVIKRGTSCKKCRSTSLEDAEKILFENHGDKIKLLEYSGMYRKKSKFECTVCGNVWRTFAFHTILQGDGCKKCASKKLRKTLLNSVDYVIEKINETGCKFIQFEEEYHGNTTKIRIGFICGHIGVKGFNSFNRGGLICQDCSRKEHDKKIVKPEEDIIKKIEELGFDFLEFPNGYVNGKSYVSYACEFGHITTKRIQHLNQNGTCRECKRIKQSESQRGKLGFRWNGGITELNHYLRHYLNRWKIESAKACNFLCIIENKPFEVIHHLYSFNSLVSDTLNSLDLPIKSKVCEYTESEILSIKDKFLELQDRSMGVCLTKKAHDIFHSYFGAGNNTSEQFEEFKQRIASGEIVIPT